MGGYEVIEVERRGPVGWLTFNRPQAWNALNRQMDAEVQRAWRELDDDPTVRVIVNTGRGRGFQVGVDLKETAARTRRSTRPDEAVAGGPPRSSQVWHTARDCGVRKPVISAVNGRCDGLGFHFVLDADMAVASSAATFVDSHTSVGLVSAMEPISLTPRIGFGAAMRMVLMGRHEPMDAARAYELGLVTQVVDPPEALEQVVQGLAEVIATNSPAALATSKRAAWQGLDRGLEPALDEGWRILHTAAAHPDVAEGSRAFAEKRPPVWQALPASDRSSDQDRARD